MDTQEWIEVKSQIDRYFRAVHGDDYIYHAPELFNNILERWMLAVAGGRLEDADHYMRQIEQYRSRPA